MSGAMVLAPRPDGFDLYTYAQPSVTIEPQGSFTQSIYVSTLSNAACKYLTAVRLSPISPGYKDTPEAVYDAHHYTATVNYASNSNVVFSGAVLPAAYAVTTELPTDAAYRSGEWGFRDLTGNYVAGSASENDPDYRFYPPGFYTDSTGLPIILYDPYHIPADNKLVTVLTAELDRTKLSGGCLTIYGPWARSELHKFDVFCANSKYGSVWVDANPPALAMSATISSALIQSGGVTVKTLNPLAINGLGSVVYTQPPHLNYTDGVKKHTACGDNSFLVSGSRYFHTVGHLSGSSAVKVYDESNIDYPSFLFSRDGSYTHLWSSAGLGSTVTSTVAGAEVSAITHVATPYYPMNGQPRLPFVFSCPNKGVEGDLFMVNWPRPSRALVDARAVSASGLHLYSTYPFTPRVFTTESSGGIVNPYKDIYYSRTLSCCFDHTYLDGTFSAIASVTYTSSGSGSGGGVSGAYLEYTAKINRCTEGGIICGNIPRTATRTYSTYTYAENPDGSVKTKKGTVVTGEHTEWTECPTPKVTEGSWDIDYRVTGGDPPPSEGQELCDPPYHSGGATPPGTTGDCEVGQIGNCTITRPCLILSFTAPGIHFAYADAFLPSTGAKVTIPYQYNWNEPCDWVDTEGEWHKAMYTGTIDLSITGQLSGGEKITHSGAETSGGRISEITINKRLSQGVLYLSATYNDSTVRAQAVFPGPVNLNHTWHNLLAVSPDCKEVSYVEASINATYTGVSPDDPGGGIREVDITSSQYFYINCGTEVNVSSGGLIYNTPDNIFTLEAAYTTFPSLYSGFKGGYIEGASGAAQVYVYENLKSSKASLGSGYYYSAHRDSGGYATSTGGNLYTDSRVVSNYLSDDMSTANGGKVITANIQRDVVALSSGGVWDNIPANMPTGAAVAAAPIAKDGEIWTGELHPAAPGYSAFSEAGYYRDGFGSVHYIGQRGRYVGESQTYSSKVLDDLGWHDASTPPDVPYNPAINNNGWSPKFFTIYPPLFRSSWPYTSENCDHRLGIYGAFAPTSLFQYSGGSMSYISGAELINCSGAAVGLHNSLSMGANVWSNDSGWYGSGRAELIIVPGYYEGYGPIISGGTAVSYCSAWVYCGYEYSATGGASISTATSVWSSGYFTAQQLGSIMAIYSSGASILNGYSASASSAGKKISGDYNTFVQGMFVNTPGSREFYGDYHVTYSSASLVDSGAVIFLYNSGTDN